MKQLNLRPKITNLKDVKLDFAEVDEDSDLREAMIELHAKRGGGSSGSTPSKSEATSVADDSQPISVGSKRTTAQI